MPYFALWYEGVVFIVIIHNTIRINDKSHKNTPFLLKKASFHHFSFSHNIPLNIIPIF